jgi:hypothetical protein
LDDYNVVKGVALTYTGTPPFDVTVKSVSDQQLNSARSH